MKHRFFRRSLALLLAAALALSLAACAGSPAAPADDDAPANESPVAEKDTLAQAEDPALPAHMSDAEFEAAIEDLSAQNLSDKDYEAAWDKLYDEYSAQADQYRTALEALRGGGMEDGDAAGLRAFTAALGKALLTGADGKNAVFSPANLYLALAALSEVTGGTSRDALLPLLGAQDLDTLRARADRVFRQLYQDDGASQTRLAAALFLQSGGTYKDGPMAPLAERYHASAYRVPMGTAEADKTIRTWLNDNTGGLLKDAVEGIETDPNTLLLLATTLYFKDAWSNDFSAGETAKDDFTLADGSTVTADFMHKVQNQYVLRGDGWTAATLAFQGGAGMTFLLPDEGTDPAALLGDEAALSALLKRTSADSEEAEVHWSVPKLDVSADLCLNETLQALGLSDLFDSQTADFSPLTDEAAYVGLVQHAARVTTDEEGCEAAAFTVIKAEAASDEPAPLPIVEMNLNRPFLFAITGVDGLPLFLGLVENPAA